MDKLIYTAGSGAKHILEKQATTSHNLANVSTTGFRAQIDAFRAVPVLGEGCLPAPSSSIPRSAPIFRPARCRSLAATSTLPSRARAGSRSRWPTAARPTPGMAPCR
jgi:hypothetical protein